MKTIVENNWRSFASFFLAAAVILSANPAQAQPTKNRTARDLLITDTRDMQIADALAQEILKARALYRKGEYANCLSLLKAQLPLPEDIEAVVQWQIYSDIRLCQEKLHQVKEAVTTEQKIADLNTDMRMAPLTEFTEIPANANWRAAVQKLVFESALKDRHGGQRVLTRSNGGWGVASGTQKPF